MTTTHTNEFSHTLRADTITSAPYTFNFEADERARALLAKRFGILGVQSLKGSGTVTRQSDGLTLYVRGHLDAEVTQACVATLDPVAEIISEDFEAYFLDESQVASFSRARKKKEELDGGSILDDIEEQPIPEDHEDPEPIVGGIIDIGEVAAQHLSLSLDPFPRSQAAKEAEPGPILEEPKPSPFAVLKDLIRK